MAGLLETIGANGQGGIGSDAGAEGRRPAQKQLPVVGPDVDLPGMARQARDAGRDVGKAGEEIIGGLRNRRPGGSSDPGGIGGLVRRGAEGAARVMNQTPGDRDPGEKGSSWSSLGKDVVRMVPNWRDKQKDKR